MSISHPLTVRGQLEGLFGSRRRAPKESRDIIRKATNMTVPCFSQAPNQKYEVTPLELFFDLVFVFAVSQLSNHLQAHLSWRGAAETLVMLPAVFAVWRSTSWAATMIPADQPRTQWMLLAVTLLGLFMNAAVTGAFTTSGWAFVVPLLLIQLGRTFWTLVNAPNA